MINWRGMSNKSVYVSLTTRLDFFISLPLIKESGNKTGQKRWAEAVRSGAGLW